MAFEAGLDTGSVCPMGGDYGAGYGMMGYGSFGGLPVFWLLTLLIVAGLAVLITYLLMKDQTRHRRKRK